MLYKPISFETEEEESRMCSSWHRNVGVACTFASTRIVKIEREDGKCTKIAAEQQQNSWHWGNVCRHKGIRAKSHG